MRSVLSAPAVAQRRIGGLPLRRFVRDISSVLIISGLLLMVDAGVTLIWQEPVTAVIGLIQRANIDKEYLSFKTAPLTQVQTRVLGGLSNLDQRIAYLARREQHQVAIGDGIGQITIPKLSASYVVVEGTDTTTLEKGPGHYPTTAFPGLGQTVAIAGHRTTYLAPFRHINELKPGDKIMLTMPYGMFTYVVQYQKIVLPTALWVTRNVGYERLVLSALQPVVQRGAADHHLREAPVGAAARSGSPGLRLFWGLAALGVHGAGLRPASLPGGRGSNLDACPDSRLGSRPDAAARVRGRSTGVQCETWTRQRSRNESPAATTRSTRLRSPTRSCAGCGA